MLKYEFSLHNVFKVLSTGRGCLIITRADFREGGILEKTLGAQEINCENSYSHETRHTRLGSDRLIN